MFIKQLYLYNFFLQEAEFLDIFALMDRNFIDHRLLYFWLGLKIDWGVISD